MVAITVPAATYTYAHTRSPPSGALSWIPKGHPWAQHAAVGKQPQALLILNPDSCDPLYYHHFSIG